MSKEKRRVPKLRFPGFTEDWEQRKLESLFTKYEDKISTPDSGYWRLGLRSHCKGTFHTYVDAGHELETTEMYRVKAGNFILNITFAWERALAVTDDEDQGKLVSHRFPQFKPNDDLVIDFFKHTLMDKRFKHHLELSSPGGAGRNKVLKVSDMLKYELLVPSIQEQNIISSFLNNVDYIITLHQRKLDNLKLKKKALLQKLFPKNGEQYPELRFPGFTDVWEQRKLGSILIEYTEKNPGNENLPILTSSRQGLTRQEEHFGSVQRHDISDYNVIPLGFCTYRNRSDDKTFTFNINRIVPRGLVSKFYPVFEIKNGNADFITEYLNNNIEIIKSLAINAVGTSQVVLSLKTLRNIEVTLPLKAEQVAIGNLMRKLDIYITLHQRKLDHLKLQKKALLQQMFV